jgi:hypothetical protein
MTPLGFTDAWFALGVIDKCLLDELMVEWEKGDDPNPEHYRYGAFGKFLSRVRPLSPSLAAALYDLGASDADVGMGTAMMNLVLHLEECPEGLLRRALTSDRPYLARTARRRLNVS